MQSVNFFFLRMGYSKPFEISIFLLQFKNFRNSNKEKNQNFNKFWKIEKLIKKKKKSKFIEIPKLNYREKNNFEFSFFFRELRFRPISILSRVTFDLTGLKVAGGALAVFAQAATVKKGFPADGAFLRSATVVPNVENEVGLFRVTGAALAAGERPALLQLVARRSRIPIAETLLVTPQMTGKGETLAAVFAIVFSFRVVPTYRVPREKLCNIINDRYQLCIIVLSFIELVEQTRVSLRKFAPDKSVCRFLIRKLLISKGRFFLMINFLFFFSFSFRSPFHFDGFHY